ncbi:hypothetical protein [Tenacibaculum singaporense]|nr:hypothetical protein [Tenacibaculum singaporense]
MIESILNLEGTTILNQTAQQSINGGGGTCGCGDWNCYHVC